MVKGARVVVLTLLPLGVGCTTPTPAPQTALDQELRLRVCEAVVASYYVGARPVSVEVSVRSRVSEGETRVAFSGEYVPMAEHCLGLAMASPRPARIAPRTSTSQTNFSPRAEAQQHGAQPAASGGASDPLDRYSGSQPPPTGSPVSPSPLDSRF